VPTIVFRRDHRHVRVSHLSRQPHRLTGFSLIAPRLKLDISHPLLARIQPGILRVSLINPKFPTPMQDSRPTVTQLLERKMAQISTFFRCGWLSLIPRDEGFYHEDKTSSKEWPISKLIKQQPQLQQPTLRLTQSRQILAVPQIWTRLRINYIDRWQKLRKHSGILPGFSLQTLLM